MMQIIIKQFFFQMFVLLLTNLLLLHQYWLEKIPLSFHRFLIIRFRVLFKLIINLQIPIHFYLFVHRIVLVNEYHFNHCNWLGVFSLGDLSSTPLLMLDNPNSNNTVLQEDQPATTTTTFIECRSFPVDSSSSSSLTSSQSQQVRVIDSVINECLFHFSHRLLMNH